MGHDPEHSATMFIPPDVYERMRNEPRADDAPAPSVVARVTRPRYDDGEERTLASQRDVRVPTLQAVSAAVVEEPSSMEVDARELLDAGGSALHPGVPVTANGTLLMAAMPYLVGQPEQTQIKRRVPSPNSVAQAQLHAVEGHNPDSARVRRELDEMSMVFEPHAISRRLATASDDEMARYLESLRASQGLPSQAPTAAPAMPSQAAAPAMPAPAHWQMAPEQVRADAAQARFDPIAQRFAPPAGVEPEPTHAPASAFAPHAAYPSFAPQGAQAFAPTQAFDAPPFPGEPAPLLAAPAYAAQPACAAQPAYAAQPGPMHAMQAPYAPQAGAHPSMAPSPFALPASHRRPPLASMPPPSSHMVPSAVFAPSTPKKSANTAMFAVMFVAALVGVGAVTYVALRSGAQGAVTGPLSSLRMADAG